MATKSLSLKSRLYKRLGAVEERVCDRWLNIQTRSLLMHAAKGAEYNDLNAYVPTPYDSLFYLIDRLELRPDDVVYDVGCGSGRVVCVFARHAVRRCVGVELSESLAEIAKDNAARLRRRRAPVEILVADATRADYTEGTVFWFADPFGSETMAAVLDRIRQSLEPNPRRIRICYLHPVQEAVFHRCGWLRRFAWEKPRFTLFHFVNRFGASYWTNQLET